MPGIQMRRGLKRDFDPSKMLPGEWAVSIDSDSGNQCIWMCFAAGVVKQIGTVEEFEAQLEVIRQTAADAEDDASEALAKAAQALTNSSTALTNSQTAQQSAAAAQSSVASSAAAAQQAAADAQQAQAETAAANLKAETADNNATEALAKATQALSKSTTAETNSTQAAQNAAAALAAATTAETNSTNAVNTADAAAATANNAQRFATAANAKAENADIFSQNAASNAANALAVAESTQDYLDSLSAQIVTLQNVMNTKFDDVELTDEGYVNFLSGGQVVVGPVGPFAGGGGGGGGGTSGNNAVITATNTTGGDGRNTLTLAEGAAALLSFNWSSLENEMPTGNGSMKIYISGALKSTRNIAQGDISADISQYLGRGSNAVTVQILDVYGNRKVFAFTITVIALSLSSTFDSSAQYSGNITFPYTPVGAVQKVVHFILDGTELGTVTTSVSGRQQTYVIPAQQYGSHSIRVYFESVIDGDTIRSNELYYEFICIGDGAGDPIITSSFNKTTMVQYSTANIDYQVYDPTSLTCDVVVKVNGETFQTLTVNREMQSVAVRLDTVGTTTVSIKAGATTKSFSITVTESDAHIEPVTEDLALHLASYGRSNNEENPGTWTSGNVSCTLSGFNFVSDGWVQDDDGNTVLRTTGDARVTVPYKIFGTDFRSTGKTIEIEFATREIRDYDAIVVSCMNGGKGLQISARGASMASEQSAVSTQFKEDEHIRLSFVVEKRTKNRLIWVYINGIASRVVRYPTQDDFQQSTPADLVIGSNDATVDIYNIRVYDNDLVSDQILDNWIADTQDVDDMLDRYTRNNVMDAYGQIVIEKLPADLPYCIIEGDLPTYKGDKKTVAIEFYNPAAPGKNFTATGVQIDVQGTSSAGYARKNFKPKFKNGFELANGTHSSTYQINANAVPTNCFCFKADVASSEGANNVELVRLYCDACPYETPAQEENALVRQGIDGFPMVVFQRLNGETTFVGKYNFNNDKSTAEVFGFVDGDESWEVLNNTSNRVIFKSDDYTGDGWLNDFEARYPDTDPAYTDNAQLAEFAAWVVSTDRTAATGDALDDPVAYDGVTYTNDTADYRLAKFKAEAHNYMEMDSAFFYYIFTELFLMVDSRAKNMFPSFIGEEISHE